MMRNRTQESPFILESPISAAHLADAAALWGRHFAWPRRALPAARICPAHGVVALDRAGQVIGVAGLRDADGGFLRRASSLACVLYRGAPATSALVIDGIATALPRQGIGRALIFAALDEAGRQGRPGLQAEVALGNQTARAFYRSLGFAEQGRGRYAWPWSGPVLLLHLGV